MFIPYSRQWIDDDDINEVTKVLKADFITRGLKTPEFEERLAEFCGAKYCVVFNSGTSALHGAYFVLGLAKGDEFITSPNTFVATSNTGLYLGAKPVFVDVEKDTGNIDVSKIEESITGKTKLIAPVHYSGHPADLEKIHGIAQKNNTFVIEDACHALGAEYKGQKIGSCKYSDMTIFSFHPVKHIATGEGGAVLTNSADYRERLRMFRSHGVTKSKFIDEPHGSWYYEMQFLGYNFRITDIQAALGISQMKKIDLFVKRRRQIAENYNEAFKDNPYFDLPAEKDYARSSYHLYPLRLKDKYKHNKSDIFSNLRERGLGIQVHYMPVYLHPYYRSLGYKKGLCPLAEDFYQREISIPLYPAMKDDDVKKVVNEIIDIIKRKK